MRGRPLPRRPAPPIMLGRFDRHRRIYPSVPPSATGVVAARCQTHRLRTYPPFMRHGFSAREIGRDLRRRVAPSVYRFGYRPCANCARWSGWRDSVPSPRRSGAISARASITHTPDPKPREVALSFSPTRSRRGRSSTSAHSNQFPRYGGAAPSPRSTNAIWKRTGHL